MAWRFASKGLDEIVGTADFHALNLDQSVRGCPRKLSLDLVGASLRSGEALLTLSS